MSFKRVVVSALSNDCLHFSEKKTHSDALLETRFKCFIAICICKKMRLNAS